MTRAPVNRSAQFMDPSRRAGEAFLVPREAFSGFDVVPIDLEAPEAPLYKCVC